MTGDVEDGGREFDHDKAPETVWLARGNKTAKGPPQQEVVLSGSGKGRTTHQVLIFTSLRSWISSMTVVVFR